MQSDGNIGRVLTVVEERQRLERGRKCWGLQRWLRAPVWSWRLTQAAQMPQQVHMPWVRSHCLAQATIISLLPSCPEPEGARMMYSALAHTELQDIHAHATTDAISAMRSVLRRLRRGAGECCCAALERLTIR